MGRPYQLSKNCISSLLDYQLSFSAHSSKGPVGTAHKQFQTRGHCPWLGPSETVLHGGEGMKVCKTGV